jgi:hypothetical protein
VCAFRVVSIQFLGICEGDCVPLRRIALAASLAAALLALPVAARTEVSWPSGQLLPSFSPPDGTQDLITLWYPSPRWEAEGPSISHATGRRDGDGWLCQTGIDAPNLFMVYGPYDTSLPVGPNTANFRMKIDNNTASNDPMVMIDVRDNTNGAILASRTITRQQFAVASDWVTFSLAFSVPAAGHAIELRVFWMGGAYIKVDWVGADRSAAADEAVMFASLKGVVNATQPRIFSYEGDGLDEGKFTWLQSLGLGWSEPADRWSLITKYRSEIAGLVVYDDAQPDTMNLATTIAGGRKALVTSASLLPRLTAAPYGLPILVDLRGQYASKLAVYQSLLNNHWPSVTHRVLIGLSPAFHRAALREYAVALGAAVVWLDPRVASESTLLNSFLSSMGAGTVYMGWWPEEASGVDAASKYGIATIASDYSTNLTVHSGTSRTIGTRPIPPKPTLQNKIYVAFVMSDGDNLQFVEHLERKLWNNPDRGKVPIGWTLSPAMLDAMPAALNYYWTSATANDALLSGPSGYGYTYPNSWTNQAQLDRFVARSENYMKGAGFRIVTVWNTIVGAINTNVGNSFATQAPSLLGLTAQNTGGGLTIYGNRLPGFAFSCNYCTNEQAMKDHIASAAAGWNGASPRFVLIQAQPWQGVTPTSFLNVKNSLNANYVVVRPDNWFQLLRQANGLPIEPVAPVANGSYRVVNKTRGKCVDANAGGTANGTVVQQTTCSGGNAQIWQFTSIGNGYYRVMTANNNVQGWDVSGGPGATGDAVRVQLWNYVGGANQQWQPVWEPDGYYHLIARHSDKCLDVPGASTADGVPLQQWTCNGTGAQSFSLVVN